MEPLTTAEEEKADEDAFYLPMKLLDDVSRIMCKRDRVPSIQQDKEWNQYIKNTQFYRKTKACVMARNCKPLRGYESSSMEQEEDTESAQSLSSEEEDNLECDHPLVEEEDNMEGIEEVASSKEEDNSESLEEVASSEEEDNSESLEEVASSEEEDNSESLEEEAVSEEEDNSERLEEEASSEEDADKKEKEYVRGFCRQVVKLPIVFGSYSSGTAPDRIPYHLYLLVKEAVDIMTFPEWHNNTNHVKKLKLVEYKIWFFGTYLHCHLPNGWKYDRDTARAVVTSYDPARKPRYIMDSYTAIVDFPDYKASEYDEFTNLSRKDMLVVMRIIHSRKTPKYWKMNPVHLLFYCRLCYCFGIDYARLEDASEDDVCLMDVGLMDD